MASSQVEVASCVLRDHNQRDRCTNNARTAFQKKLKDLVRDHLTTCISNSSPPQQQQQQQSSHQNGDDDDNNWEEDLENSPSSRRQAQVLQRWTRAREKVTAIEKQSREAAKQNTSSSSSLAQSHSSMEIQKLGCVSSLVQRWSGNTKNPNVSSPVSDTRVSDDERFETPSTTTEEEEEPLLDWESDRTVQSALSSDAGERVRVADVIKKLTTKNHLQGSPICWKNDNDHREQLSAGNESLPRLRMVLDHQQEQRCSSQVISSPRIRGRQAFNDLLVQLERDRQRELHGLMERGPVSRFSHKGRIQAMLRLRFLRREAAVGNQQHSNLKPVGAQQRHSHRESSIGIQQRSHGVAATGAQQQHSPIGVQQRSHGEAAAGAQKRSHGEAAAEAPQHSHREAPIGVQQRSHGEAATGAQQQSHGEAAAGPPQHSYLMPVRAQKYSHREAPIGVQQRSHGEAATGAQQQSHGEAAAEAPQHSNLMPVEAQKHLHREAPIGVQQRSHGEAATGAQQQSHGEAASEARQHSHSSAIRPQQLSCHEGTGARQHSFHEGAWAQQHSHSATTRFHQQSCWDETVENQWQLHCKAENGAQQPSPSEATVETQLHSDSKAVGVQDTSHCQVATRDGQDSHLMPSESNRPRQGSVVVLLREKFDVHVEHEAASPKPPGGVVTNNILDVKNSSNSNQLGEKPQCLELNTGERQRTFSAHDSASYATEDVHEVASTSSGTVQQGTNHEASNLYSQRSADGLTTPNSREENVNVEEEEASNQELTVNNEDMISDRYDSESYATADYHEEANTSSGTVRQGTNYEASNLYSQRSADRSTTSNSQEEIVNIEEQEANNQELTMNYEDMISDLSYSRGDWGEQESSSRLLTGTNQDWMSEVSCPQSEEDEEVANEQLIVETSNDWVSDISRPKSDWECLRQARYQEMLDPYLDNEEIRQLLARRSVSTFLSSNLRETMDQLMLSRMERLPDSWGNQEEEEQGFHNRLEQLMASHIQRQTQMMNSWQEVEEQEGVEEEEEGEEEEAEEEGVGEDEEEEKEEEGGGGGGGEEEEEEEESLTHVNSWSHEDDQEVSDDSDQGTSSSLHQPLSSQASYPGIPSCSPFTNRSSVEMELEYYLKGCMEEIRHEMSQLQKSMKSCVNMQVKLQHSIRQEVKKEVARTVNRSVRGKGKQSFNSSPRKGTCCICCEMQVDSLLYRCGHMCTCFRCANELQWSSGKCPICRAPIVDVVRAYTDS